MKIDILCVGKIKEKFYRDAIDEYSKRLSRYCSITAKYLRREKDWDKLKQSVGDRDQAFVLTAGPSDMSSEGLAERIRELENRGIKTLHFFVPPSMNFGFISSITSCFFLLIALRRVSLSSRVKLARRRDKCIICS